MSDTSDSEQINDIVLDEPMFYILTQFLETKDGKNITTVLEELTNELRELKLILSKSVCAPAPTAMSSTEDSSST